MARYVLACCLFCHDAGREHDFQVRLGKKQRYHGCKEGKSFSGKMAMEKRILAESKKKADFSRRNNERTQVKIKHNKKLCPICRKVWTVNHFACNRCLDDYGNRYEIDGLITFQSGGAYHITRRGSWAT